MNLKDEFIKFFVENGHKQIPSAPVVPENDPSVLFNTAGMQPLIPYLMGQTHPYGTRLCDYQKCIRTNDLEEVGDKTHHTFFEMLGNWSLGDYFKEESITYSFNFLTKVLNIPTDRLAVTVYAGDENVPYDQEAHDLWKNLGIKESHIASTKEDNFWAAGETGPCGTDTEIFYFRSEEEIPEVFDTEDDRWVEIWNNVFMQFNRKQDGTLEQLPKKNVDTGMGYERVLAVLEGVNDNYKTSLWRPIIKTIEEVSNKTYNGNEKSIRIIADHIRTAVFIAADDAGIKPSNTDQGYILRRLIRRAIRHAKKLNIDVQSNWDQEIANSIIEEYKKYSHRELTKAELAKKLNEAGTRNIATLAKKIHARLIHISTDYVFDGKGTEPYTEESPVAPIGVYGKTKAAGEDAVKQILDEYYIIRTAWLYGWTGRNFVYTMIKAINANSKIIKSFFILQFKILS